MLDTQPQHEILEELEEICFNDKHRKLNDEFSYIQEEEVDLRHIVHEVIDREYPKSRNE